MHMTFAWFAMIAQLCDILVQSQQPKNCSHAMRLDLIKKMMNDKDLKLGLPIKAVDPEHKSTLVMLNMGINDMFNLDEVAQSLEAMLRLNLTWIDTRLSANCSGKSYEISEEKLKIWRPEIAVSMIREANVIKSPNSATKFFVRASEGGIVHWISHLIVKMSCEMNLQSFPFDVVVCKIFINRLQNNFDIQWEIVNLGYGNTFQSHKIESIVTANLVWNSNVHPMLFIKMRRYLTYYTLQGFIPNMLIVMVAWVSFFIDPSIAPARVSLGASSLVALVLQYGNVMRSIPKVGYIKMIDLWTLMCIIFIIYSLLEFAYICLLRRGFEKSQVVDKQCHRIDRMSRVIYPICFLLFLVVYVAISVALNSEEDMKMSPKVRDYKEHSTYTRKYL